MSWRNKYLWSFLKHAPKKELAKAAIEAGIEVPYNVTKQELRELWHDILKH